MKESDILLYLSFPSFYFKNLTLPLGSIQEASREHQGAPWEYSESVVPRIHIQNFQKTKKSPQNHMNRPPSLGSARDPQWIRTQTSTNLHLILFGSADRVAGTADWAPTDPIFRSVVPPKDRWRIHMGRDSALRSLVGGGRSCNTGCDFIHCFSQQINYIIRFTVRRVISSYCNK